MFPTSFPEFFITFLFLNLGLDTERFRDLELKVDG